jgi:outer membrane protein OmpA-like peptidoglycan-associated protein
MAGKPKPGFYIVLTMLVLGLATFSWYRWDKSRRKAQPVPSASDATDRQHPAAGGAEPKAGLPARRMVVGVNDFGGAYPAIVANDGALPGPRSIFSKLGLDVEIKLIKGSKERLQAFDEGKVHIMLLTLDYLAGLMPEYRAKGIELRAFMMADWSRGNCGIVATSAYKSIESLKRARIATTKHTPTHYLLLSMLSRSNLTPAEIETVKSNFVFATKTPLAADIFQRGEADAAGLWEPYLSQAVASGRGHVLVSTESATNLIADVLFARLDFLNAHEQELPLLIKGWLQGVQLVEQEPQRAIDVISRAFKQDHKETANVLGKIKPATFADNREFLGLDKVDAQSLVLFAEASRFWQREGWVKEPADPASFRWLKALAALANEYRTEKVVERFEFAPQRASAPQVDPLMTKSLSIYFASGADRIDSNAKKLIDTFAETLLVFQNTYVRIEGNTDSTGKRQQNIELSKRRAMAVVDYLAQRHRLSPSRFLAVGQGPDNPIGDNRTTAGREVNRRTDFKIITNRGTATGQGRGSTGTGRRQ